MVGRWSLSKLRIRPNRPSVLRSISPSALPLLRYLLHELLGRRLPLSNVPRLCGYVLEPSTSRLRESPLT